ncbi:MULTISPECIES: nucleoside hydrolase [unclassified Clostridium]|jgi:purine nucleosidase|uniref:nucleoside hydrolase n=1 Tax=Clostridia TaxID=186801 RepID=UPI00110739E7|nr:MULTISPECIES: nucleoside hydrolase [unclassified Clostridium]
MAFDAYKFTVPENKRFRVIVNTDCKNEADDQFALAHHLMTPKFDVRGIIAAHFEAKADEGKGESMQKSYDEILKVLELMELTGQYPVLKGAPGPLPYDPAKAIRYNEGPEIPLMEQPQPVVSEGAQFIVDEAMREDDRPLFVVFLGAITDLASAYLMEPRIAGRLTAVWIGGGEYPAGEFEFNMYQDIQASNIVLGSEIDFWQIPKNVYKMLRVTLAELQCRVAPHGKIGQYLFEQLVQYNDDYAWQQHWPQGESWNLGDQPTVSVLLEAHECEWEWWPAPLVSKDMYYVHHQNNRPIRVFKSVDSRMTLEDFYCKLQLNYGQK